MSCKIAEIAERITWLPGPASQAKKLSVVVGLPPIDDASQIAGV
jgi:hypothetical protein